MLTLDIFRILESREIQNPLHFLHKNGFNYHTSRRLLSQHFAGISYRNLEKLCLLLNCTPDDLFSWSPDNNSVQTKPALKKLSGRQRKGSILNKLKQLPEDKLEQIRQFVDKVSEE